MSLYYFFVLFLPIWLNSRQLCRFAYAFSLHHPYKVWVYLSWDSFQVLGVSLLNEKYSSDVFCLLLLLSLSSRKKASCSDYEAKCDSAFAIHKLYLIQVKLFESERNFDGGFFLPLLRANERRLIENNLWITCIGPGNFSEEVSPTSSKELTSNAFRGANSFPRCEPGEI